VNKMIFGVLLLVFSSSCAGRLSDSGGTLTAQLLDFGICQVKARQTEPAPTGASGARKPAESSGPCLQTTRIPAAIGTTFGIKYALYGKPQDGPVNLTFRVVHPPIDGKTASSVDAPCLVGTWRENYYIFEQDNELVEGTWRLQVLYDDRLLLEQAFTVYK